jgi:hypothetical protein
MRNRCCYLAYLSASSPGDYAALAKLAEREGFELTVRNCQRSPLSTDLYSFAVWRLTARVWSGLYADGYRR